MTTAPAAEPVLIAGSWRACQAAGHYRAVDPATGGERDAVWPLAAWDDVDVALEAARAAADLLAGLPAETIARFLEAYAARLEARAADLVAAAHAETGLAVKPRLADAEMPRTLDQLRQAAAAAREGSWRMATIDTPRNIRAAAFGAGPVVVLPPANFPLAFGAITGGDFAAAIAAGNPVIAKAHRGHPSVSRLAAVEAAAALAETGMPAATVQLLHGFGSGVGERLVADPRVAATAFTGGREAGERLAAVAAAAGRVFWGEMGSLNPLVLLPGALAERGSEIAKEFVASITGSAGQLCTKPGLAFVIDDAAGRTFVEAAAALVADVGPQVLLGVSSRERLEHAIARLREGGGRVRAGGTTGGGACRHAATLVEVTDAEFRARPDALLTEAFGNASLVVRCADEAALLTTVAALPGSLATSLYVARDGRDAALAAALTPRLATIAGRIVFDRMSTGVAVSPAMHHGGPWPAATPPFYSAVGMPWTILRFARRICFDGAPQERLPDCLRDGVPAGRPWRFVDGGWVR